MQGGRTASGKNLVTERTRIANQMKAILARFGIRSFKPTLRKAAEKLDGLRTAEGTPLLENTRAELCRHLARLRVVREPGHTMRDEALRTVSRRMAMHRFDPRRSAAHCREYC